MDGDHSLARCQAVTEVVQHTVFSQLRSQGVLLEGMILKPNMVIPGKNCPESATGSVTADAIADATIACLLRTVPAAVPGVAFLSGGQTPIHATERLNAMHVRFEKRFGKRFGKQPPWALTFSFSRALQQTVLAMWAGDEANAQAAQQELLDRAHCNRAARRGAYRAGME